MLEMISGKGSRDDEDAVKDFFSCCGYYVWAVPIQEVLCGMHGTVCYTNPGRACQLSPEQQIPLRSGLPHTRIGLFIPQHVEGQEEKGY